MPCDTETVTADPAPPNSGPLKTGLYTINNFATCGFARLSGGMSGSAISQWFKDTSTGHEVPENIKWNFTLLDNGYYTIASHPYRNFALVTPSPGDNDVVKVRGESYQWIVRSSLDEEGQYLIYPDDNNSLYWSFNNMNDTQVRLTSSGNNLWTITPVDP
ncbi:hypothetical protein BJ138DRAFT_753042 [Hygrophoropsis aurantiaca]|uniref:Uncharacterized protein n=1 Tax=Hygrophoropsis aurantiaca TaxID=72124 RepID=A0ACB7ZXB0_9AGAM|nr:hypothetical protein BJ138DRAFT_753042 [Hygrophoropsis aurantiaca]